MRFPAGGFLVVEVEVALEVWLETILQPPAEATPASHNIPIRQRFPFIVNAHKKAWH